MAKTVVSDFYQIIPGNVVKLSVTIGNRQNAVGSVILDGDIIGRIDMSTQADPIYELDISKDNLEGSTLLINIIVHDTNKDNNYTSVTVKMEGGVNVYRYTMSHTVANDGDYVAYTGDFEFFTI